VPSLYIEPLLTGMPYRWRCQDVATAPRPNAMVRVDSMGSGAGAFIDAEWDTVEEEDGEESVEEMLELDQVALDELGSTLDDPHQPDDELAL